MIVSFRDNHPRAMTTVCPVLMTKVHLVLFYSIYFPLLLNISSFQTNYYNFSTYLVDGLKSFASRDDSSNADNKNGEKSIKSEQESVPKRRRPPSAMEPTQRNRTLSDSLSNGTTPAINQQTDDSGDEEEYKVAISSQTINHILIGEHDIPLLNIHKKYEYTSPNI